MRSIAAPNRATWQPLAMSRFSACPDCSSGWSARIVRTVSPRSSTSTFARGRPRSSCEKSSNCSISEFRRLPLAWTRSSRPRCCSRAHLLPAIEQQRREPDDRGYRRAQLVRRGREEHRLELVDRAHPLDEFLLAGEGLGVGQGRSEHVGGRAEAEQIVGCRAARPATTRSTPSVAAAAGECDGEGVAGMRASPAASSAVASNDRGASPMTNTCFSPRSPGVDEAESGQGAGRPTRCAARAGATSPRSRLPCITEARPLNSVAVVIEPAQPCGCCGFATLQDSPGPPRSPRTPR